MSMAAGSALAGIMESHDAKKRYRRIRKRWIAGEEEARARSEELASQAITSPEFQALKNYILGTFNDPSSSPIAKNYASSLRQAQTARGTYFSGGYDEARRISGLSEMVRGQLLPNLESLIGYKEKYRQNMFSRLAPELVQRRTYGEAGYMGPPSLQWEGAMMPLTAAITGWAGGQATDFENIQFVGSILGGALGGAAMGGAGAGGAGGMGQMGGGISSMGAGAGGWYGAGLGLQGLNQRRY